MTTDLLTTAEAAKRLNRSQRWVQNIILRGKLRAERVANVYVVRTEEVERYRLVQAKREQKTNGSPS